MVLHVHRKGTRGEISWPVHGPHCARKVLNGRGELMGKNGRFWIQVSLVFLSRIILTSSEPPPSHLAAQQNTIRRTSDLGLENKRHENEQTEHGPTMTTRR